MTNFILKFGKYKGQLFLSTPVSYQNWLMSQNWFKAPNSNIFKATNSNAITAWGVYLMPTKEGAIFANLKPELVEKFDNQDMALEFCDNANMTDYLDEIHSGYSVKPIYK